MPRAGEYLQIVSDPDLVRLVDAAAQKAGLPRARFLNIFLKQRLSEQSTLEGRVAALEQTLKVIVQARSTENWLTSEDKSTNPKVREFIAKSRQFKAMTPVLLEMIDAKSKLGPLSETDKAMMKDVDHVLTTFTIPKLVSLGRALTQDDATISKAEKEKRLKELDRLIQDMPKDPDKSAQVDDLVMIPLIEFKVAAGGGAVHESERILKELAFERTWIKNKLRANPSSLKLVAVTGDSMEPTVSDGDLVMFDTAHKVIKSDQLYVLRDEDDGFLVKRLRAKGGHIEILSDNPAPKYHRQPVKPDQIQILGKVVWMAGRRS